MGIYKLYPECKDYLWGGTKLKEKYGKKCDKEILAESWELSFHPDGLSKIIDGRYLKDVINSIDNGPNCESFPFFPMLIKFIDAKENLSVQVHPSDEYAIKNENSFGKSEMWYIVEADKGAGIYLGLKENTSKEEFEKKVKDGTIKDLLNFIPVKKGECYFIKSGTIHAICKGCLICEIQQNSNITYRVYDYKRKGKDGKERSLHLEKALDVINFNKYEPTIFSNNNENKNIKTLANCKHFKVSEVNIEDEFRYINENSFVCITCLSGKGFINDKTIKKGESFYISCKEKFTIKGKLKVLLSEVPKKKYYAGIDLGGTYIKAGIIDEDDNVIIKDKIPTLKDRPYQEVALDMVNLIRTLEDKEKIKVEAIGIGSPGTINTKEGIIVYSNNFDWKSVPFAKEIENITHLPCKICNDANVAALGEYSKIKNKYKSMVFLTLGTGIGSGIIIDGNLFEGYKSAGAELGHQVIKRNGNKCTCGRKGCLEAYCSTSALIQKTKKEMLKNKESKLWTLINNIDDVNGKTIFEAFDLKDKLALKIINEYINNLATGLVNIINAFRPEIILIGGGVSARADVILSSLRKKVYKEIFGGTKYANIIIDIAKLQNDAGFLGAALLNKN